MYVVTAEIPSVPNVQHQHKCETKWQSGVSPVLSQDGCKDFFTLQKGVTQPFELKGVRDE